MLHSGRFTALLDANVIYPAPVRDLLMNLGSQDLYKPKWTNDIQDEWIRSVLKVRSDLNEKQLRRTQQLMDAAFPDAVVENYEELIPAIILPDPNDRHVVAAAIRGHADVIVSNNVRDFPEAELKKYDLEVQTADEFISNLIELDLNKCMKAIKVQSGRLNNPAQTSDQLLATLEKCGLTKSVHLLRKSTTTNDSN